jgi:protein-S-isoprenylcysteine O-methyltransferase Ste14
MPRLAFPLYALFIALGFFWRSWLQWRRTGDTGIRALSPTASRVERGASLMLGVALALLGAATYGAWLRPPGLPALDHPVGHALGLAAALAGLALTVWAQLQMGRSWRIGLDRSERTELVRSGLYARVRNPIYSAMLLAALGLALLAPSTAALAACALLWFALELQVRAVEEPHLLRVHGEPYRSYLREVGRFIPGIGRSQE